MIKFTYPEWNFFFSIMLVANFLITFCFIADLSKYNTDTTTVYIQYVWYPINRATIQAFQFHFQQIWVFVLLFHRSMIWYLICNPWICNSENPPPNAFQTCRTWNLRFSIFASLIVCSYLVLLLCFKLGMLFGCLSKILLYCTELNDKRLFLPFFDCFTSILCYALCIMQNIFSKKCYLLFSLLKLLAFTRATEKRNSIFPSFISSHIMPHWM